MSTSVIEIVKFPANELMNGKPEIYQGVLRTLSEQGGLKNVWYPGPETGTLEDPKLYYVFIEWSTYEDHESFLNSPQYQPFEAGLVSLLGGELTMCHVPLNPAATNAFKGPVVSYRIVNLNPGLDRQKVAETIDAGVVNTVRTFDKCTGVAWGFTREDDNKVAIVTSWESKEAHLEEYQKVAPEFQTLIQDSECFHMNIKHYNAHK
ncbi:hypothetical protein D9758_013454 [Tetrapyrgos nigripes]|uniref:ABM domain-containing protein n=1 Tax=Tetrapyrgos nigripes TaxID=182062 RepID=A0A8H5FRK6_9AGAR|nr:hypothetical protein D9758_013454 [Tetrapyrgos nigripes]